jgi:hypothetical protein
MPTVVIDPGHGGTRDAGRSSWGGVARVEKEVNLDLARRVAARLGGDARLTRDSDVNLDISSRAAVARQLGARVFVSLHGHEGGAAPEAFVHPRAPASSHALARALARRVRVGEMAVLTPEHHAPGTAACLLEVPSLSRDPRRLEITSRAIAAGIRRYLGGPAQALDMRRDGSISPFATSEYPEPWVEDAVALEPALSDFKDENPALANRRFPFAIVSISETPDEITTPHVFAGYHMHDFDFIASLAKIAAMYASFELRSAVQDVLRWTSISDADNLWSECESQLDGQISGAVPAIPDTATPSYKEIFTLGADKTVDFTAAHRGDLVSMISRGTNTGAAGVIQRLGFQYINGALAAAGFFKPGIDGLWLTGDFVHTPLRLANTLNDQLVGQAGTPYAVAKLFTHLAQRTLVDPDASDEMLTLLGNSLTSDPPFIARNSNIGRAGVARTRSFDVTHNKLGLEALKPVNGGFNVHSEGSILRHRATGHRFVVAWQNAKIPTDADFTPITRLFDRLIENLLDREGRKP